MNTNIISNKVVMGAVLSSLVLGSFAFVPMYADAAAKKSVDLTCMQTAIDTREDAILDAFEEFNSDVEAGLAARKTALHDAWGMTDKVARQAAIKKAWTDWKAAKKSAHTDLKAARKSAWEKFKTTVKTTCKETLPKDEALEKDASGTIAL
jgi:hypothetical protein